MLVYFTRNNILYDIFLKGLAFCSFYLHDTTVIGKFQFYAIDKFDLIYRIKILVLALLDIDVMEIFFKELFGSLWEGRYITFEP